MPLCDNFENSSVWNATTGNFNSCYGQLLVEWPSYIIFLLLLCCYSGKTGSICRRAWAQQSNRNRLHVAQAIGVGISVLLLLNAIAWIILQTLCHRSSDGVIALPFIYPIQFSIIAVSWILNIVHVCFGLRLLSHRPSLLYVLICGLLSAASVFSLRGTLIAYDYSDKDGKQLGLVVCGAVSCGLSSLYFCLLVLTKWCSRWLVHESTMVYERSFNTAECAQLGQAGVRASWYSRLFFCWVIRLLARGYRGALQTHADLFDLPRSLHTQTIAASFLLSSRRYFHGESAKGGANAKHKVDGSSSGGAWVILRALLNAYGKRYFALGLLKFTSDLLSFAGPFFLSKLVSFIDSAVTHTNSDAGGNGTIYNGSTPLRTCALFESDPTCQEPLANGLLYATAITTTQFGSGLLLSHFNYQLNIVSMSIRAALLSVLFNSAMRVDAAAIRHRFVSASKESGKEKDGNEEQKSVSASAGAGELGNYAAVDVDRIVNVAASFHASWSLPLQCAVVFYLLHSEIGLVFLVGVAFALLQIPLNRFVAKRIGTASSAMMQAKDARARTMRELLSGMRTVKLCALERTMASAVARARKQELRALRTLKFLDAVCVYFWACTPLLISLCTFTTFALTGGRLTAARVFTAMSLFNMLISPLNAFPWVINGLVDAFVSMRRVSRLLLAPHFSPVSYYRSSPPFAISNSSVATSQTLVLAVDQGTFAWYAPTASVNKGNEQTEATNENPQMLINAESDSLIVSTNESDPVVPSENANASDQAIVLRNISISVLDGQLIGVVGEIGSGKSAFLQAILGELYSYSSAHAEPSIFVPDALLQHGFAYVAQESWLQNASVRDNVLFGRPFDSARYERVLFACALVDDMRTLAAGDRTVVGDGGSKLSGGQKARLALARAVYAEKRCYLLDDPYAAVDAHVAAHIHRHVLAGPGALLAGRTRIVCTHQLAFLHDADMVFSLRCGRVTAYGPPSRVLPQLGVGAAAPLRAVNDSEAAIDDSAKTEAETAAGAKPDELQADSDEEVNAEEKETGTIRLSVYRMYIIAVGIWMTIAVLLSIFLMQASRNSGDGWLSYWVANSHDAHRHNPSSQTNESVQQLFASAPRASPPPASLLYHFPAFSTYTVCNLADWHWQAPPFPVANSTWMSNVTDSASDNLKFYLGIYGALALANTFLTLLRAFTFALGGLRAARVLQERLLRSVLGAQLRFFDQTPVGRILNRFTADVYAVDDSLPFIVNILLAQAFGLAGTIVVTCIGLPWFALALVPLGVVYWCIQHYYRRTSREVKRISSVTLSPIFSHFSESVGGAITIRAYREISRFEHEFLGKVDTNQKASFNAQLVAIWLQTCLQLLGVAMIAFVSFIAVLQHELQFASAGVVGLAISYALSVSGQLSGTVTAFADSEKQMVSVERIQQYLDIPHEREFASAREDMDRDSLTVVASSAAEQLPATWPDRGIVQFEQVFMRYGPDLPLALDGTTFETRAGEKLGIVGRTGSGKSSLFLTLFGVLVPESGRMLVDGRNVGRVPLRTLRSRLAIIPQDPFLFSGTVYENLVGAYDVEADAQSDAEEEIEEPRLSTAETEARLRQLNLYDAVTALGGLEAHVGEQGASLSVGQRQLLCLIRALLRRARVICIDEATASVDEQNEALLHAAMRDSLRDCTALVIAHRLRTVVQFCDRVMVMRAGAPIEIGEPHTLLADSTSNFYKLYHGIADSS